MSKTNLFEVLKRKTKNPHESIWDHHGSYQWTYFNEEIKERINFFLSRRLHGKNIDLGGGWYLSYPNSTVVDLSSVCLANNPANEKLQFDLNTLGKDKHLPYESHSFDSATLISSWQYLRNPAKVTKELKRVLRPGAEIYIINGQGAGLEECVCGSTRSENVQKFFRIQGYDTLIENIPSFGSDVKEFQAVCVAMPDKDMFGNVPSTIRDKKRRAAENQEICENPSIFQNDFADWELEKRASLLSKISIFPITKCSQEYLERVERFSQEYHEQTKGIPLIFLEHTLEPELFMLTPGYRFLVGTMFLMGEEKRSDCVERLLKSHKLSLIRYSNYFNFSSIPELLENCEKCEFSMTGKYTEFISSIGLNSFTKKLQAQIYQRLSPEFRNFNKEIEMHKAFNFHMLTCENKQERRIDELIRVKDKIEKEDIETLGKGKLNYFPYINKMREFILKI